VVEFIKDRCHATFTVDCEGLSSVAEAEPHNRGLSGAGNNHPGASGGSAAVPAKAGFDLIKSYSQSISLPGSYRNIQ